MINDKILATVAHYCEDSIIITTKDLDAPGPVIVYVNPAFTRMTGYNAQEVVGKSPRLLQGPETDKHVLKRLRQTLEEGKVFYGEAVNYRKDGTEFINEWHIEPIRDDDHQVIYYLALQRDITQKKQTAIAIEQKNMALREVLEQIQIEKKKVQDDIINNVHKVLIPTIKKIRLKGSKIDKKYLDVLEQNLKDIIAEFGIRTTEAFTKLSVRELEIANLIKSGLTNKEIAQMLNLSDKTVETHRNRIRTKLKIVNKHINLTSYLKSS